MVFLRVLHFSLLFALLTQRLLKQIENAEVSKQIPEQVIDREHLGDPDDMVTSYALLLTLESGQLGTQETSLPQSSSQTKPH